MNNLFFLSKSARLGSTGHSDTATYYQRASRRCRRTRKACKRISASSRRSFVIRIAPRGESTKRSVATNNLIQSLSRRAKWRQRGTSHEIYSNVYNIDGNKVHLNDFGLSVVKKSSKTKYYTNTI